MQARSYRRWRKAREPLPDTTPKMAAIRGRQFSVNYSLGWLEYLVCHGKDGGKDFEVQRCLRACSHVGGGPQVDEVPRLGGVTNLSIQSLFFS